MRNLLVAIALLTSVVSAQANVITQNLNVDASAVSLENGFVVEKFNKFDATLGNLTAVSLEFAGVFNPGNMFLPINGKDVLPATVWLWPNLVIDDATIELAQQTVPVGSKGQVWGNQFAFDVVGDLVLDAKFINNPNFTLNAYTWVVSSDGQPYKDVNNATSLYGNLTLTYDYIANATAVPEPASLLLLTMGILLMFFCKRQFV